MESQPWAPTIDDLKAQLSAVISAEAEAHIRRLRQDLAIVAAAKAKVEPPDATSASRGLAVRVVRGLEHDLRVALEIAERRILRVALIIALL